MRTCTICGTALYKTSLNLEQGWICCDEYYCSKKCLDESFIDADGLTWEEHYTENGNCFYTEWELEEV